MAVKALTTVHSSRLADAVVETVRGRTVLDFNPWDLYVIDAGYCIDAISILPAGSHETYGPRIAFSSTFQRGV